MFNRLLQLALVLCCWGILACGGSRGDNPAGTAASSLVNISSTAMRTSESASKTTSSTSPVSVGYSSSVSSSSSYLAISSGASADVLTSSSSQVSQSSNYPVSFSSFGSSSSYSTGKSNFIRIAVEAQGVLTPVELTLTRGDRSQQMVVTTAGQFYFDSSFTSGELYRVTLVTDERQQCELTHDRGMIGEEDFSIGLNCRARVGISGRITGQTHALLDRSLNDTLTPFSLNDTLLNAQPLENLSQIQGFATSIPLGVGHFAKAANDDDFYSVYLRAGQIIRLRVVDINRLSSGQFTRGDLDLFVYSATTLKLVGYAMSAYEYEEVYVPQDGLYFINVKAYSGSAKYFLTLLAGKSVLASASLLMPQENDLLPPQATEFVVGEALVNYHPLAQASLRGVAQPKAQDSIHRVALNLPAYTPASASQAGSGGATPPSGIAQRDTLLAIKALGEDAGVQYAEPNFYRHAFTTNAVPNDPGFPLQWHHRTINSVAAWSMISGMPRRPVVVAVIDTGIVMDHPDFNGVLVEGYDFIRDSTSADDGNGIDPDPDDVGATKINGTAHFHGTHVAGIIAAQHNNFEGGVGVAPETKIMPIRYLGKNGGTSYDLIQALRFAAGMSNDSGTVPAIPADIINLSLGSNSYSLFEQQLIDELRARGILVVAAAGNAGTNETMYPAGYRGVIGVGATTSLNILGNYSNYGSTIDLVAPGGDLNRDVDLDGFKDGIFSTFASLQDGLRNPTYTYLQGTSMAAPQVSAVLAMMQSIYRFTPQEIEYLIDHQYLTRDIGPMGRDNNFGNGLLDAQKAVATALDYSAGQPVQSTASGLQLLPDSLPMGSYSLAQIRLDNKGLNNRKVMEITVDQSWLSIDGDFDLDAAGMGHYNVRVDRAGLVAGNHFGEITFHFDNAETLVLPVHIEVEFQASVQQLAQPWVALIGMDIDSPLKVIPAINREGEWRYQFSDLAPGSYSVIAGSDIDADGLLCTLGETCGGVGGISKLRRIQVVDSLIIEQDLELNLMTNTPRLTLEVAP